MKVPKRIHVVPLGFEHDRIILPLLKYNADELYLVIMKDEKYGKKHLENVENTLNQKGLKYVIWEADLLDLVDCIRVFGEIVYDLKVRKGHDVYVNVSTSTSISAIGISFAAMLWGAKAYHVQPKRWVEENRRKPGEPLATGLNDVIALQRLHLEIPDRKLLYVLYHINEKANHGKVSYSDVLNHLWDKGWLKEPKNSKFPRQAVTRQFQERFIRHLKDKWNFVFIGGQTRGRKIGLTEEGKKYLRMFEYLV